MSFKEMFSFLDRCFSTSLNKTIKFDSSSLFRVCAAECGFNSDTEPSRFFLAVPPQNNSLDFAHL